MAELQVAAALGLLRYKRLPAWLRDLPLPAADSGSGPGASKIAWPAPKDLRAAEPWVARHPASVGQAREGRTDHGGHHHPGGGERSHDRIVGLRDGDPADVAFDDLRALFCRGRYIFG